MINYYDCSISDTVDTVSPDWYAIQKDKIINLPEGQSTPADYYVNINNPGDDVRVAVGERKIGFQIIRCKYGDFFDSKQPTYYSNIHIYCQFVDMILIS